VRRRQRRVARAAGESAVREQVEELLDGEPDAHD
jgi:hypothetical protein